MRATPVPELMLEPAYDPAGSGRDAIGASTLASKGLNVRHGTILTWKTSTSASMVSRR